VVPTFEINMTNDPRQHLDPVLAHSLLGSVAAVKGALDTVMAHSLDGTSRDSLLMLASRRLDYIAEQLRHLALGLPEPEQGFTDELLPHGSEFDD
jgi:hypothetical protein